MSFNVHPNGHYQKSLLLSPTMSNADSANITEKCVSFWFASFPGKDNLRSQKSLMVFQAVLYPRQGLVSAKSLMLWKLVDDQTKTGEWLYGQVTFNNEVRYRVSEAAMQVRCLMTFVRRSDSVQSGSVRWRLCA